MSFNSCMYYCQRYGECRSIILMFKAYESTHGEEHPIARMFFSERSVPHCHKPYPPEHHIRSKGSGGTNS